jgi:hypothetical protein
MSAAKTCRGLSPRLIIGLSWMVLAACTPRPPRPVDLPDDQPKIPVNRDQARLDPHPARTET